MNAKSTTCRTVAALVIALLLTACTDNRPAEEIVTERAQARWDALVARDYREAWSYLTPGYRETLEDFDYAAEMARRPIQWTSAEVFLVECNDEKNRCQVRTRIEYSVPPVMPGVGTITSRSGSDETWLQIDGQWWYHEDS